MTRAVCIALRAPSRGWPVPVISIARTWSSVSPCSSGVHGSEKRCHAQPWRSSTAARVYGSRPSMLTSTSAMPREDRRGGDQTVDRERPAVGVDLWNSEMGEHEDVFCGCDGVQHRVRRELDAANAARRVHRRPAWVCGAMRRLLAWVLDHGGVFPLDVFPLSAGSSNACTRHQLVALGSRRWHSCRRVGRGSSDGAKGRSPRFIVRVCQGRSWFVILELCKFKNSPGCGTPTSYELLPGSS